MIDFMKLGLICSVTIVGVLGILYFSDVTMDKPGFYGTLSIIHLDSTGKQISSQTIHNRLVDEGEQFFLEQAFRQSGTDQTNNDLQIASICLTSSVNDSEGATASNFDSTNGITGSECKVDTVISISGGQAVIGPLTFVEPTNMASSQTVAGIGICQGNSAGGADFSNCQQGDGGGAGILFAIIDTADVTIGSGESVQITYTFDISSTNT